MTILSYLGIFASIDGKDMTGIGVLWVVIGIFLGSMSWWVILSQMVYHSKKHLSTHWLYRIKILSTLILAVFGGWAIVSAALPLATSLHLRL